jgi:uncharacterized protein YlxP (DUF503 family)
MNNTAVSKGEKRTQLRDAMTTMKRKMSVSLSNLHQTHTLTILAVSSVTAT